MRLIGHLPDETHARRFGDFLYNKGIESQIDPGPQRDWEIWVLDDEHIETAQSLLDAFSRRPDDPVYVQVSQAAARQRQRDEAKLVPRRGRVVDARTVFYKPPVSLGALTMVLIGISITVTLLTDLQGNEHLRQTLSITQYQSESGYIDPDRGLWEIWHGQIWRLFTPMFLHFGILHIFFNMLWLRDLGSMVEAHKGSWMLLALVLVLAGTSNVAQYLYSGPSFGGMSGVVYGLFGYIWMQSRFNPASQMSLQPQTVTLMVVWFFLCLSGLIGPIANTAHAVGAGVGIAWGFLAARLPVVLRRLP